MKVAALLLTSFLVYANAANYTYTDPIGCAFVSCTCSSDDCTGEYDWITAIGLTTANVTVTGVVGDWSACSNNAGTWQKTRLNNGENETAPCTTRCPTPGYDNYEDVSVEVDDPNSCVCASGCCELAGVTTQCNTCNVAGYDNYDAASPNGIDSCVCNPGSGWNATESECQVCQYPRYNNVTSRDDECVTASCPAGKGVSENSFLGYTYYSCADCDDGETSPEGSGQCGVCSTCPGGQYESAPCTTSTDTVCTDCSTCNTLTHYQNGTCSGSSNTECVTRTVCHADATTTPGGTNADDTCACKAGFYGDGQTCTARTVCHSDATTNSGGTYADDTCTCAGGKHYDSTHGCLDVYQFGDSTSPTEIVACADQPYALQYIGRHNIQETVSEGCASDDNGGQLREYRTGGIHTTELYAAAGETRYFKCSSHCSAARFEVSCPATATPCVGDITGDGITSSGDLTTVINDWGCDTTN